MDAFEGRVAVITGAGSGFGREFARRAAGLGMKLMLADVEAPALAAIGDELRGTGAECAESVCDVSRADDVEALAQSTRARFGAAHLLFNNAGVGGVGGFLWENTVADWQWVIGVNLMGVAHGIRSFVPMMLAQNCDCHVVNTASAAGLLSPQMMGIYNASKHAVVSLSETLRHDLRLTGARIGVSVLCPAFVPTGIVDSRRNRPPELTDPARTPTASQQAASEAGRQALADGRLSAEEVARLTFEAVRDDRFYILTHPEVLPAVGMRMQDILEGRAPRNPVVHGTGAFVAD